MRRTLSKMSQGAVLDDKTKTADCNHLKLVTATLCRSLLISSLGSQGPWLGLSLGSRRRFASPENTRSSC